LLCDFHNKFHLLINWLSYQFFHCFVEDLVVYKDISILHALYVYIWYVFNKLSSLNKDFVIIIIIIIIIINIHMHSFLYFSINKILFYALYRRNKTKYGTQVSSLNTTSPFLASCVCPTVLKRFTKSLNWQVLTNL